MSFGSRWRLDSSTISSGIFPPQAVVAASIWWQPTRRAASPRWGRGEIITGKLFCVPSIESAVGNHGVVPCLAIQRPETPQLPVLVGVGGEQNRLATLGHDQEQLLIGQLHDLSTAISASLPTAFPGGQIDAAEHAHIKAVGMAAVQHEIRELRLQVFGRPA